ncbi:MAG: DUF3826 domain-containing protein [Chitinophagaceae bacterium]
MKWFLPANMNKQSFGMVSSRTIHVSTSIRFFILFIAVGIFSSFSFSAVAQQNDSYQKTIADRAGKIVSNLGIADSVKYKKVQGIVAGQYLALSKLQDDNTAAVAAIKQQQLDKDKEAASLKSQEEKKQPSWCSYIIIISLN